MATFSQNGVQFTALAGQGLPNKYGNGNNGNFADAGTDGVETFINAVEIDWNKANLSGATAINTLPTALETTGQLLGVIKGLANRITALENAMVTVSNGLVASLS